MSIGQLHDVVSPLIDIVLLSNADYFILNCVSTFSAFVRRHRVSRKQLVAFFGLDYPKINSYIRAFHSSPLCF